MAIKMRELLAGALPTLRYEPTEKHLRIDLEGEPVADTIDGLLVWEPRRVVPTYAVPHVDVAARLESSGHVDDLADLPVLVPTNPFAAHSCTGAMTSSSMGNAENGPSRHSRTDCCG
jgi:hypothetical protein